MILQKEGPDAVIPLDLAVVVIVGEGVQVEKRRGRLVLEVVDRGVGDQAIGERHEQIEHADPIVFEAAGEEMLTQKIVALGLDVELAGIELVGVAEHIRPDIDLPAVGGGDLGGHEFVAAERLLAVVDDLTRDFQLRG